MSDAKPPLAKPTVVKAVRAVKAATAPVAPIRLNKRMADLGLCSRREADDWIEQGWVKVNGQVALMGTKVLPQDRVEVDKRAAAAQSSQVTILLNKPIGYVSGQAEDGHQPAASLIASGTHWQGDSSRLRFARDQLRGLAPAGRLDIDSTGLLVLTQDGRVARQLIGEDSDMEKEYLVRVIIGSKAGPAQQNVQAQLPLEKLNLLRFGLSLDGQALKRAQVDWQNPEQLRFVLKEGKKRQIRRMCEAVGLHVISLKRVRIGRVMLGQLPMGQWRYLGPGESF
ncbi:MAG: pseudouridine synthase [Brachymonas sp.]